MKLLLSPHPDDCELFSCFTALRHKPLVIVCFSGALRHGPREVRLAEMAAAMEILGCEWTALPEGADPRYALVPYDPEWVWAPLPEEYGHSAHNRIGELAAELWPGRVSHFTTYSMPPGQGTVRTKIGSPVKVEPGWDDLKRRALACYQSQIKHRGTSVHFSRDLDEYVVESLDAPR